MVISKTGGLIAAASKKDALPLMKIGSIPIIKRIVLSFQQAGIFPIVIITGADEFEVKNSLTNSDVIFLRNEDFDAPPLIDSVKIGLEYLSDKCERVVFTPVNVPMFAPETLRRLIETEGEMITPAYKQKGGHPVVISSSLVPEILSYSGDEGLRGFSETLGDRRISVEVEDEGILLSVHNEEQLEANLEKHNRAMLHSHMDISLEKEDLFFGSRSKLLLFLILDTHSVKKASDMMALSLGKAWEMLNKLEKELGYSVVERRHGGSHGGRTDLTERGLRFLIAYQNFESNVFMYAHREFVQLETKHIL